MHHVTLLISFVLLAFTGCGYQLGGVKPVAMKQVDSIYVKVSENRTEQPGLEADLTNFLTDALLEDATYQVGSADSADAILETSLSGVEYRRIRAAISDGLRPEELNMSLTVNWRVVSRATGKVITSGTSRENTRFFVDNGRLTTARENAFPDGLARVSRKLVSTISNSF